MKSLIEKFSSVNTLKNSIEKDITDIEKSIEEYSTLLGEKIRMNEETSVDDPEFLALKDKLTNDTKTQNDEKKSQTSKNKKTSDRKKKKNVNSQWYDLNEILIYNGLGLKGELELYFKAIDALKAQLENNQRILSALNNILEKGLKSDMSCMAFKENSGLLEIVFLKNVIIRENYSLKSTYSGSAIPVTNIVKIGV